MNLAYMPVRMEWYNVFSPDEHTMAPSFVDFLISSLPRFDPAQRGVIFFIFQIFDVFWFKKFFF